ncbi:MAG: 3-hydroxyacyl-CoA dehydrogenase [Peptoniphilaceae bacterium]|nr:3-hydroxyacyl-CoA dehydrogenase [Peptoniphilaceae bacterium]MDY3738633.1 3-hydroxyacyl-CoA dehydrogenase [Peptoniphilaceae bacterium]
MEIKNVAVCGGGVLGTQIALQCQYSGFNTTIWLRSEGSIERTKPKLEHAKNTYLKALDIMNETHAQSDLAGGLVDSYETFNYEESVKKVNDAYDNLKIELDMKKAFEDVDLIIETISEDLDSKINFYKKAAPLLPEKTIICTNTSSLLPSKFMEYTGREDKFLALHFANNIFKSNTAEVMMTSKTDEKVFETVVEFAKNIRMIPIKLRKEKPGYLLNSMLIPLLFSGFDLYVNGISTPEDIDAAWKYGTGAIKGPFEIFDIVGLETAYEISNAHAKLNEENPAYNYKKHVEVLEKKLKEGKKGVITGEGFYKYDKYGKKLS